MIQELKRLSECEEELFDLIQNDKTDAAVRLVEGGNARVNCLDKDGMSPLDQACFKGNERLVDFLITNEANVDNRAHKHGYTALMFAAIAGKPKICQSLLDGGAKSDAVNIIGKTAAELAAFVGQFECVSVISSYIGYNDIDVILHPKGEESDIIYPKELILFIHNLTKTHEFHPIRLILNIAANPTVVKYRKKLLFVVDTLFERQLRCKQPNEVMSIKLWIILYTMREIFQYVAEISKKQGSNEQMDEINDDFVFNKLNDFARNLLLMSSVDLIRPNEERFLRTAIASFPYKHLTLYQTLARQFKEVHPERKPPAFLIVCQALLGSRAVETAHFCLTCGVASSQKRCRNCKSYYCSIHCQKLDWPIHKKCCGQLNEQRLLERDMDEYD